VDLRTCLDLAEPGRGSAGKSAEPAVRASDARTLEFDREQYNREAQRLDEAYAHRGPAERAAAERAAAQTTLDSLRENGRSSSTARAAYKFER
jgi:hypothetical protein